MREILFKAKVLYNGNHLFAGQWVEGSLIIRLNGVFIYVIEKDEFDNIIRMFEVEVDPETVCQFTGLTDKNGVKIFEGDIVKWTFGKHYWEAIIQGVPNSQSINLYAMETFHNCTKDIELEEYTYERSDSRQGARNDITYLSPSVEITGNIHDNPELINN